MPLGLFYMRPLQHWLHDRVPRRAWHARAHRVSVTALCRRALSPWSDPSFLQAWVSLEQASSLVVVSADASNTGWGAVRCGHAAADLWKGTQLHWHIACGPVERYPVALAYRLELLAVFLALHRFFPVLERQHVLVRTDSTAAVAYISRIGGMRSRRMSQLARRLLLWSHPRLKSLHAIHIQASSTVQPMRSHGSLASWSMETPPRVCSADMGAIRGSPDRSVASPEIAHCQLFFP
ncbi:uncharacterized protein [Danio rerio]|uniref:Uncharacterized protein n=1 Tax=Danio rerio TaxID=7955 RepID=A0AC58JV72_DANRE